MGGPHDEATRDQGRPDVEREAMFFAVLRERARPTALPAPDDVRRRLEEAEQEISDWLDEAEEEGGRILEQARADAARLRLEAHEQAELLRQAAERAAAETARDRERLRRQAEVEVARVESEAHARAAELLREAERAATALHAERIERAEREAEWVRVLADNEARAREAHAAAVVRTLQADVGLLQQQLAALVEHATALLPALEAASQSLAVGPSQAATLPGEPEHRGLGQLVGSPAALDRGPDAAEELAAGAGGEADGTTSVASIRRLRPLGRLLRRT